jgi:hypothetical protein
MQIHAATHNAAVDMPAMRYLGSSGQVKRRRCIGRDGLPVLIQNIGVNARRGSSRDALYAISIVRFGYVRCKTFLLGEIRRSRRLERVHVGRRAGASLWSMIPKSGNRFSEMIMFNQTAEAAN